MRRLSHRLKLIAKKKACVCVTPPNAFSQILEQCALNLFFFSFNLCGWKWLVGSSLLRSLVQKLLIVIIFWSSGLMFLRALVVFFVENKLCLMPQTCKKNENIECLFKRLMQKHLQQQKDGPRGHHGTVPARGERIRECDRVASKLVDVTPSLRILVRTSALAAHCGN